MSEDRRIVRFLKSLANRKIFKRKVSPKKPTPDSDLDLKGLSPGDFNLSHLIHESFDPEIKNFWFPTRLGSICPSCSQVTVRDFRRLGLERPRFNKEFELQIECKHCNHIWSKTMILNTILKESLSSDMVEECHITAGSVEMRLNNAQTAAANMLGMVKTLLNEPKPAENYVEMKLVDRDLTDEESFGQTYTITFQRTEKKTPHELRREAEVELAEFAKWVDEKSPLKSGGGLLELWKEERSLWVKEATNKFLDSEK